MLLLRLEQADELVAVARMLLRSTNGIAPRLRISGIARIEAFDQRKIVGVCAGERPDPGEPAHVHTRELEAARGLGADRGRGGLGSHDVVLCYSARKPVKAAWHGTTVKTREARPWIP